MKNNLIIFSIIAALALPSYAVMAAMNMDHMNSEFKEMDKMMNKAEKTTDSKQRRQYMNEHMGMMMKQMDSMDNMMKSKSKGEDMHNPDNMGQRMDMMQMMMDHMMRQQNMMMENMK